MPGCFCLYLRILLVIVFATFSTLRSDVSNGPNELNDGFGSSGGAEGLFGPRISLYRGEGEIPTH